MACTSSIRGMTVMAPSDENECRQMLYTALQQSHPTAVRYPRGAGTGVATVKQMAALPLGKGEVRRETSAPAGKRIAILAFGTMVAPSLAAAEQLDATVANMHLFADRLDVPFSEVAALCEVDARIAAAARKAPARKDRRSVTGIEEKTLRNLVMYPRTVAMLDEEAEEALLTVTRHGELFAEVTTHARALGDSAAFQLLSDLLRNGANAPTFEEIFRKILDYDENVRDLLLKDPQDAAVIEERREQERIVGEELKAAILKMRYDAYCDRLEQLSRQSRHTPEEFAEFSELNRKRADMDRVRVEDGLLVIAVVAVMLHDGRDR